MAITIAVVLAGFGGGYLVRVKHGDGTPTRAAEGPVPAVYPARGTAVPALPEGLSMVSADRVDDLLAESDGLALYRRIALWILDADEESIAAFWNDYHQRSNADEQAIDLLLIHWTRKNPSAAIAAAKGSRFEEDSWWACGINDPEAALSTAKDVGGDNLSSVLWAMTTHHPDLALKALQDPALKDSINVVRLADMLARKDPEAALQLLAERKWPNFEGPLRQWARDDPHKALAWLTEHRPHNDKELRAAFIETLEHENPDALTSLAAATPSGEMKRLLEAASFRYLVESDPAAALAQARTTEAPRLAAERLAVVGRGMLRDDPEAALGLLGELLAIYPNALTGSGSLVLPGVPAKPSSEAEGARQFIYELATWNPQATFEAGADGPSGDRSVKTIAAGVWASRDLEGFKEWLESPADPSFRNRGETILMGALAEQKRFAEAMGRIGHITREGPLLTAALDTFQRWAERDASAAGRWLEEAEIPDADLRETLQTHLPAPK